MRVVKFILSLSLAVIVMVGLSNGLAVATNQTGFAVSPAFEQMQIQTGSAQVQYSLQITNHNATDQTFLLSVVDFGTLDESGGVAFLGTPSTELEHKYGLASWMTLEKNTVFVPAGKSVAVIVSVENRQSLAPGGHYGAVLATAINDPGTPAGDRVAVKQVLSSLVLVTKDGGAVADLRLASQAHDGKFWRLPTLSEQRFQNAGNVHVVPRGTVEVKDPWGRVVERASINEGSNAILPESFRRYKARMTSIQAAIWPGYYAVVTSYRYDGSESLTYRSLGFWYAGQLIVWLLIIAAICAALALAWWLWWRPRKRKRKQ